MKLECVKNIVKGLSPLLIIIVVIIPYALRAQSQNNNWLFGNGAGINFNGTGVTALTGNAGVSIEGCASVSGEATGELLFYSNGLTIWNRNNDTMVNGTNLLGGASTSSTQGVTIVPYPGKAGQYVVFTIDETFNGAGNGFRYSVVDMTREGGLGAVISGQKNILVQTNTTERLAVARKQDGSGYWIVIHERNNNVFKAYELGWAGLESTPVVSTAGTIHSTAPQPDGDGTMGYMKMNNAGNKIAVAIYAQNKIDLLDFDNCSGVVADNKSITTIDHPYGIEFSPDDQQLYFSVYYNAGFSGIIYQANMTTLSTVVAGISSSYNNQCVGALQCGPNNKIYVTINSESWLSAIDKPNEPGPACTFIDKAVLLPNNGLFPRTGLLGLPASVPAAISSDQTWRITVTDSCADKPIALQLTPTTGINNLAWAFGDGAYQYNADLSGQAIHSYGSGGYYSVQAIAERTCGGTDTIAAAVTIAGCDSNNCVVTVPGAFTPNNDGLNDALKPVITCPALSKYGFHIYNRWGEMVFSADQVNQAWNGTYKQQNCDLGCYNYLLTYYTDKQHTLTGTITLLR